MSRVSPYAATPRSARPIADYGDPQSTRPLELGRSIRPTTPTNSTFSNGPSRPQRSGLRTRQGSVSSIDSRITRDSRLDSTSEAYRTPPRSRPRPTAMPISTSPEEMSPLSAASSGTSATMSAALSALQSAGQRRRAMTAGSQDAEWERQRTLEQEAEQQLQKRIKDRVPQRRARGKAKAGDIDGMHISPVITCDAVFTIRFCPSGTGSDPRRMGTMHVARCKTYHLRQGACHTTLKLQKVQPCRSRPRTFERVVPGKRHAFLPIHQTFII